LELLDLAGLNPLHIAAPQTGISLKEQLGLAYLLAQRPQLHPAGVRGGWCCIRLPAT